MTKKEEITAKIQALELQIADNQSKVADLKHELATTPPSLLERDADAETMAEIDRKNQVLRKMNYLPNESAGK